MIEYMHDVGGRCTLPRHIRRLESPVRGLIALTRKNNAARARGSGWSPDSDPRPAGVAGGQTQTGRAQGFKRELPLCRPLGPE